MGVKHRDRWWLAGYKEHQGLPGCREHQGLPGVAGQSPAARPYPTSPAQNRAASEGAGSAPVPGIRHPLEDRPRLSQDVGLRAGIRTRLGHGDFQSQTAEPMGCRLKH